MFDSTRARLWALGIAAVVGIVVAACGSSAGTANPAATTDAASAGAPASASTAVRPIKVIYSSSAVDAQIANVVKGMQDVIPKLDEANGVDISLEVMDAGLSSDKQISDLQTAIVKKPDVLIVDPVDVAPIVSVVEQAKAAGIKVWGGRPSAADPAGLWDGAAEEGLLEVKMADNMKAWMQSLLDADPNLALKVGICYGAAAQTEQLVRGDIVKTLAAEQPNRVQVVVEKFCDWSLQIAQDATTDFITAHPDLNLVVTANNQMAQGAMNAVSSAGKGDTVKVASYDIDTATAQAIADGKLQYTTGFEMFGYGDGQIQGAVNLVLGKQEKFDAPVFTVTKDNATEVIGQLHP